MRAPVRVESLELQSIDLSKVLLYMGQRGSASDEQTVILEECVAEARESFGYMLCWTELDLSVDGGVIRLGDITARSESLARHLRGCERAIVFAATVGISIDRLIAKYSRTLPIKALCMQAIGAERIEALCDEFCDRQTSEGRELCSRFSPGYGDLSLDFQRDIFALLDCPRKIGLTLNDSLLMSPTKSVTAVVGIRK